VRVSTPHIYFASSGAPKSDVHNAICGAEIACSLKLIRRLAMEQRLSTNPLQFNFSYRFCERRLQRTECGIFLDIPTMSRLGPYELLALDLVSISSFSPRVVMVCRLELALIRALRFHLCSTTAQVETIFPTRVAQCLMRSILRQELSKRCLYRAVCAAFLPLRSCFPNFTGS
jgi:hypothetical protein